MSPCPDLNDVKKQVSKTIFPQLSTSRSCTIMLISNLAQPEWINIDCRTKELARVFCKKIEVYSHKRRKEISERNLIGNKSLSSCPSLNYLLKSNVCYFITWCFGCSVFGPQNKSHTRATTAEMIDLAQMLLAVGADIESLQVLSAKFLVDKIMISCKKYYTDLECESHKSTQIEVHGYHGSKTRKVPAKNGGNVFSCTSGILISSFQRCDGIKDCPGNHTDEENCICTKGQQPVDMSSCKSIHSASAKFTCGVLFYKTADGSCEPYRGFRGVDSDTILQDEPKLLNLNDDLFLDSVEDELKLKALLKGGIEQQCLIPSQVPCKQGHSKCYNLTDICIYMTNHFGFLHPCRNGGHLKNCSIFECNKKFKCPNSYCIPWIYVYDGKRDCPHGEEEIIYKSNTTNWRLKGVFHCRNIKPSFIPLACVCDQVLDCPEKDDEELCELKNVRCPEQCLCLGLALQCDKLHDALPRNIFISVSISNTSGIFLESILDKTSLTTFINLEDTGINDFCAVNFPDQVLQLKLKFHIQSKLESKCFYVLNKLKFLSLDNNKIVQLSFRSFSNLSALSFLNLSSNPLQKSPCFVFVYLPKLKLLSLENEPFSEICPHTFVESKPKIISTNDFQLCCVLPEESVCHGQFSLNRMCNNLLSTKRVKASFLGAYIFVTSISALCIFLHVFNPKCSKVFRTQVICLNVNDVLFISYLCIMWTSELIFKEYFPVSSVWWRTSQACFSAFFSIFCWTLLSQVLCLTLS